MSTNTRSSTPSQVLRMREILELEKGRIGKPFTIKGDTPAAGNIFRKFLRFMLRMWICGFGDLFI
jgi:hypothetical protein